MPYRRAGLLLGALLANAPAAAMGQAAPERPPTPISRQDLTRILSSGTYANDEIAGMIGRACLSFVPTATERELYRGLGAGGSVLSAIDACLSPPTALRAPPSELTAQPLEGPPTTFASVRPENLRIPSADRPTTDRATADRPTTAQASAAGPPTTGPPTEELASSPAVTREGPELSERPEPPEPSAPLRQPTEAEGPPLQPAAGVETPAETAAGVETSAEMAAEMDAPLPEPGARVEAPPGDPSVDAGPDTASAMTGPDTLATPTAEPVPAPPADEVGRLRWLAARAAERGDPETLVRVHRAIVALAQDDPLAWFQLGAALASVGQGDEARNAFIRAATLDRAKRRARP